MFLHDYAAEAPLRYKYVSKYDLRFIFIGLVLNYGTVLRIPCGVYKHGASFVAAYVILSVLLGFPLIYLEIYLGQYHTKGPYDVFKICPFFEGLGLCFVIFCMWFCMYYVFLMAHGMHLMAETFYTPMNISDITTNRAGNQSCIIDMCNSYLVPRNTFYFSKASEGQQPKKLVWNFSFALCLLIAWFIIYIITSQQLIKKRYYIRWSCFSPAIIIIFLATLYIVKPKFGKFFVYLEFNDWEQYSSVALWVTALQQVLLSTGLGTGVIVTFSSYNDFNTNRIRGDACILNIVAFVVNVSVAILFVEVAGTFNYDTNSKEKNLIVPQTPAEIQLLYFNMMHYLPVPQVWMSFMNLLFIIMGTVSVQLLMEVLLTTLKDNVWLTDWRNRFLHCISCVVLFLISLVICIDTRYFYAANAVDAALNGAIMYLEALLLLVIISIYGIDTVLLDIRFMFKEHPRGILVYMKYSWVISFILIASAITMKCVFLSRGYIGEILIIVLIFLPLFLFAVYNTFRYLLRGKGNFLFKPILAKGPENESFRQMRGSFVIADSV